MLHVCVVCNTLPATPRELRAVHVLFYQEEEEYETKGGRRRTWDDDFVLKRQFSALVPAFDPRPGRTNVQQTTDLEIPPPGTQTRHSSVQYPSVDGLGLYMITRQMASLSHLLQLHPRE